MNLIEAINQARIASNYLACKIKRECWDKEYWLRIPYTIVYPLSLHIIYDKYDNSHEESYVLHLDDALADDWIVIT